MPKRRELIAAVSSSQIDRAEALVRTKQCVIRGKLPDWKQLAPTAQEQLVAGLVARGLEINENGALRVPLREQAEGLSRGGARLPLKAAQKRMIGATPKARDEALAELCRGGDLHLVVRTRIETLVGARDEVLSPHELERLTKTHDAIAAVLKLVRKKALAKSPFSGVQKTLLREDAATLLAPFASLAVASQPVRAPEASSLDIVLRRIQEMEEPPILLVWVPDLVKSLAARLSPEEVHRALFSGRRGNVLELRQESGVGRLSPEESALCPLDPDGVPLSHVRRLVTS